jgi:5-keto 4-deoxyuronate isomerase
MDSRRVSNRCQSSRITSVTPANATNAVQATPNTVADTQRLLGGLGRTKIYDLVNRRELVKVNIGTRGMITMQSIQNYIERLSTEVVAAAG